MNPEESLETGIGLVGAGVRVMSLLRRLRGVAPAIRVVAVFDPSPKAGAGVREEFGREVAVCASNEELLARPDVRWVMIGSPNNRHREQVVSAFAAGKDVFCEKPLATTLEDCLEMRSAWKASGRHFFFGFCLRYSPLYRKIHDIISRGGVGRILSFEFNETLDFNHGGYIMGNWRRFREKAGTHLLEKCCHDIDLANWFTRSVPVRAASFGGLDFFRPENSGHAERIGRNSAGRPAYGAWPDPDAHDPFQSEKTIVDNQVVLLEYASGARATFHTNCNAGIPERRFYLLGSEGAIRADALTGKIEHRRIGFDSPTILYDCASPEGHHGGDERLTSELAACMTEARSPEVGMDEGIQAAIACFGADDALDRGEVVDLAPLWAQAGIPLPLAYPCPEPDRNAAPNAKLPEVRTVSSPLIRAGGGEKAVPRRQGRAKERPSTVPE